MGVSISNYWYKYYVVTYIDTTTDKIKTLKQDSGTNKNTPSKIAKAPNYKNYNQLSTIVTRNWKAGILNYTERY